MNLGRNKGEMRLTSLGFSYSGRRLQNSVPFSLPSRFSIAAYIHAASLHDRLRTRPTFPADGPSYQLRPKPICPNDRNTLPHLKSILSSRWSCWKLSPKDMLIFLGRHLRWPVHPMNQQLRNWSSPSDYHPALEHCHWGTHLQRVSGYWGQFIAHPFYLWNLFLQL